MQDRHRVPAGVLTDDRFDSMLFRASPKPVEPAIVPCTLTLSRISPPTVGPSTSHPTALVPQRLQYKYKFSVTISPKRRNTVWCPKLLCSGFVSLSPLFGIFRTRCLHGRCAGGVTEEVG